MPPESEATESATIANIWTQRSLGIDLPKNLKAVLRSDIEWLCNRIYPFIQLVNTDAVFTEETTVNFSNLPNNWVIHDYGEAVSASAPHDLNPEAVATSPKGTGMVMSGSKIGAQIIAATEIARIIAEKGWKKAELIAGTKLMQRFVWIESERYGFEIGGHTPSEEDLNCYERLAGYFDSQGWVWDKSSQLKNKPTKISGAS